MKNETLKQFSDRMGKVNKEWEYQVGPRHSGRSRAGFNFEGQLCCMECSGFKTYDGLPNKMAQAFYMAIQDPKIWYWTEYMVCGPDRAKAICEAYNASPDEAPYAEEENTWFNLCFKTWEDLMVFVYDRHTGAFKEKWGEEKKEYVNCF